MFHEDSQLNEECTVNYLITREIYKGQFNNWKRNGLGISYSPL